MIAPAALLLAWAELFSPVGAPAHLHLRARYRDAAGGEHRIELWRDGARRLVRRTDGRLTLFAERDGDGEVQLRLHDAARNRAYRVSRQHLARLGTFADWGALATLLERPAGLRGLRAGGRGDGCRWYEAELGDGGGERICWSRRWRIPLRVEQRARDGAWRPSLVVDAVTAARDLPALPVGAPELDADRDLSPRED